MPLLRGVWVSAPRTCGAALMIVWGVLGSWTSHPFGRWNWLFWWVPPLLTRLQRYVRRHVVSHEGASS